MWPFLSKLFSISQIRERKYSRQLEYINKHRKKHGRKPLKGYYELDSIAKGHSKYMAKYKVCNHDGSHKRLEEAMAITGGSRAAENVAQYPARGYNKHTAKKLVSEWMKSSGHKANLLNPNFKRIGIGIAIRKGQVYATQIFTD
jgi:uncharacterized protein YkwD